MRNLEGIENHGKQTSIEIDRKPVFCLYFAEAMPKSTQAIAVLKPVLDGVYKEGYDLRVIDIYQDPAPLGSAHVTALPLLMREYPSPVLRIGSDFSSADNIRRISIAGSPQETLGG